MNIRIALIIIIISLLNNSLMAALPSVEGLFRNANNKALTGGVVVLKFMIEETLEPVVKTEVSEVEATETLEEAVVVEKMNPRYFKFIFSVEEDEKIKLLQIEYLDGKMKNDSLLGMAFLPDIVKRLNEEEYVERSLFYSILMMLTLNKSGPIGDSLIRFGSEFKRNEEALNQDKMKLLEEYKNYLSITDDAKKVAESLESPLRPADEEKQELVTTLMKQSMYQPPEKVKLVRENGRFFWRVRLSNIVADFTNEEHRISNLSLKSVSGSVETNYGDYVIFDGIHELPKLMMIKDMLGRTFKLRMLDLDHITNKKGTKMTSRAESYQKRLKRLKNKAVDPALLYQKKIFLY